MAPLTLTILGAGPAAPNPGGANSGYLVRQAETAVVLDCGPGTAGQIALHLPPDQLTALAISHFHPDHYFDLVAIYYLLKYAHRRSERLPVFVPPGGRGFLRRFAQVIAERETLFEDVLDLREYTPNAPTGIGRLEFTFQFVQHYIPAYAMRIRTEAAKVLTFSGDVAPCEQLPEVARDADLFMCESALLDPSHDEKDPAARGHMSAIEAGAAARAAAAKRLLITHYRSSPEHDAHHLASARESFSGPVDLARPGATYTVA